MTEPSEVAAAKAAVKQWSECVQFGMPPTCHNALPDTFAVLARQIQTVVASHDELTAKLAELDRNFFTLRDAKIAQNHTVVRLEKERDELARLLSDSPCGKGHPMKFWVEGTTELEVIDGIAVALVAGELPYCQICRQIQESEAR